MNVEKIASCQNSAPILLSCQNDIYYYICLNYELFDFSDYYD